MLGFGASSACADAPIVGLWPATWHDGKDRASVISGAASGPPRAFWPLTSDAREVGNVDASRRGSRFLGYVPTDVVRGSADSPASMRASRAAPEESLKSGSVMI